MSPAARKEIAEAARKRATNRMSFEAVEVLRFKTPSEQCHYILSQTKCMDYRFIVELSPEAYDEMLQRGWRRNGNFFFRPACPACSECKSLRVPVQDMDSGFRRLEHRHEL